jgi:hypothetical protein
MADTEAPTMLSILGRRERFCDLVTRREMLRLGGLAGLGLNLAGWLQGRAAANESSRPARAKACIFIYMWGGPAHQDVWDLKPEAPTEIRGEFQPIDTSAAGIQISEHMPRTARQGHRLALVRSVTHGDNNHSTGAHAMLTGRVHRLSRENFGPSPDDFPHFGSVLSKLRPAGGGVPTFVALPERIRTTNGPYVPGQGGGMIGKRYDPFTIDQHPDEPDFAVPSLQLPGDVSLGRLDDRRVLLKVVDQTARHLGEAREVRAVGAYYDQALNLISSPAARRAFDLSQEEPRLRDRYGRHTFGQSCLLARRLIEAGVGLVTVYWHRDQPGVDTTWDTHANNFRELKNRLMPQSDQGFATLLDDLASRGLLDETLVVWTSEFGRTPRVNANAGRDHWGRANSIVFAGGAVPGGQVYGATDATASAPARDPVSPADVGATVYQLLGIDPHTIIYDALARPFAVATGEPIVPLLGV